MSQSINPFTAYVKQSQESTEEYLAMVAACNMLKARRDAQDAERQAERAAKLAAIEDRKPASLIPSKGYAELKKDYLF